MEYIAKILARFTEDRHTKKRLPHFRDNLFLFWYSEKTPTKIINLYDRSYFGAARRLQNRSIPDVCEDFASKADDEIAL
jgi:hypothetical protein